MLRPNVRDLVNEVSDESVVLRHVDNEEIAFVCGRETLRMFRQVAKRHNDMSIPSQKFADIRFLGGIEVRDGDARQYHALLQSRLTDAESL
jgi:hypothetical protein